MSKKNEVATFNPANFANLVLSASEDSFTLGDKVIKNKVLTTYHARAEILVTAKAISDNALSIECGRLTPEEVAKVGYTSVVAFISDCFGSQLDTNTIQRYIRVARIFADYTADGYQWKAPISKGVSVTNLCQIIALVFEGITDKDKKDVYKLSESERNALFDRFVEKYRPDEDGGLPLQGTNKALRKYLSELKASENDIPTTAEEVSGTTDAIENDPDTIEVTEEVAKADRLAEYTLTLNAILAEYANNEEIEKAVIGLMEVLGIME